MKNVAQYTTVTNLLYKNVYITTVQKILGLKKLFTTQIYGHIMDATAENELNAVNFQNKKTAHSSGFFVLILIFYFTTFSKFL